MTTPTNPTPNPPVRGKRYVFIIGLIVGGVLGLQPALGGVIASVFHTPYRESTQFGSYCLVAVCMVVVLVSQLTKTWARGSTLFAIGPRRRWKWIRAIAVVSVLVGLVNLEIARRTADFDPVETRFTADANSLTQLLIETKDTLVEETKSLGQLKQHKAELAKTKPQSDAAAKLKDLIQQDQTKINELSRKVDRNTAIQKELSAKVAQERAEKDRLSSRIIPDEEDLHRAWTNFAGGVKTAFTSPSELITSRAFQQLGMSLLCFFSALVITIVLRDQPRFCENGLWFNGQLHPWTGFDSYRRVDGEKFELINRATGKTVQFAVAADKQTAAVEFLAQRFTAAKM